MDAVSGISRKKKEDEDDDNDDEKINKIFLTMC